MHHFFKLDLASLENFDLPVLRFNLEGICTHANAAANELMELPSAVGLLLCDLFPEPVDREKLMAEVSIRLSGQASFYNTHCTLPGSMQRVPISVFGLPETGEDGRVSAKLAIVRDMREPHAVRDMHEAMDKLDSAQAIFEEMARLVQPLLPYDEMRVVAVSHDRRYLRRIFSTDAKAEHTYPFRWWPMPEFLRRSMESETPRVIDIDEMFGQRDFAKLAETDKGTRNYRNSGVRWCLSLPVWQGDRIVAFVSFDSRAEQPYGAKHLALCERLPLSKAAIMALQQEENRRLHKFVKLLGDMAAQAADVHKVAELLTQRLAHHFDSDHVAIFQYDEDHDCLRVLSEASNTGCPLGNTPVLHREKGVVSHAFYNRQVINIPNLAERPPSMPGYVEGVQGMQSELAIPIAGDTHRWVLNIESRLQRAFIEEDVVTVKMLALEAGHILDRVALLELRNAVLNVIQDGVVETNRSGTIRRVNTAASQMLGHSESELQGRPLAEFIADEPVARQLTSQHTFSARTTALLNKDGGKVNVLLSGAALPDNVGGRVFVATNLTYEMEQHRVAALKDVFRNASLESRIPLALAAEQLSSLVRKNPALDDQVRWILQQLRKADLPLERLLRLAATEGHATTTRRLVDLHHLLDSVLSQMPENEVNALHISLSKQPVWVRVAVEDLRFCVESMLAFALRTKPQSRRVEISVSSTGDQADITVRGDWVPDMGFSDSDDIRHRWRRQTTCDLALATGPLADIVEAEGGRFTSEMNNRVLLRIELPKAAQE